MKYRSGQRHFIAMAAVALLSVFQSAKAQLACVTNNGAITITGYTGPGPTVTIPATTNGYPVTAIGNAAFRNSSVTGITLPNSVTNIGTFAFSASHLTKIAIPNGVISIGVDAFELCNSLTNITVNAGNPAYSSLNGVLFDRAQDNLIQYPAALINSNYLIPDGVTTISDQAFYAVSTISSVTIPNSVRNIGNNSFAYCAALNTVYFGGNAPHLGSFSFYQSGSGGVRVNYLPGTTGWAAFSAAFGPSLSASLFWQQTAPEILNFEPTFGVHSNQFGFTISWATNADVVVDACTNLSHPVWVPVSTNVVIATTGAANFTDVQWSRYQSRFYRLRFDPPQFTYTVTNGAIMITGYTGSNSLATIPATLIGNPVTTIGIAAFEGETILTGVTMPNSVTNIGAFAFAASGVTEITIPDSVIGIGHDAFSACNSLTNISVSTGNSTFSSLNGVLFDRAQDVLIQYPAALTNYNYCVPATVTTISDDAFYSASGLGSVTIPNTVKTIGNDAFAYCVNLTTVYFEGNAPNVGSQAFYETGSGNGVTVNYIPGTTGWTAFFTALGQTLAASRFWYLPGPEILNFEPSFGVHSNKFGFTISWATNASIMVDVCTNLANPVWLPVSTSAVTANTGTTNFVDPQWSNFSHRFYRLRSGLPQFTYVVNNGAITITGYIGSNPSVIIPATLNHYPVTAIGDFAFEGDLGVTGVSIPNSVTNIGAFAFYSSGLTGVSIPNSVIGIGQNAFGLCRALMNISVNAGSPEFSSLNGVLFDGAQDTLIQFPDGMATDNYVIPSGVTTISDAAFYGADGLNSVTIPNSVTSIGDDAFAYCIFLNSMYFEGNAPNVGPFAFYETDIGLGVTVNYLPGTAGWPRFCTALGTDLGGSSFWYRPGPQILNFEPSFGVYNNQFGFTISWATNATVVVDACTNFSNSVWLPVATNTVTATNGTANFSDSKFVVYPRRFYRLRLAPGPP
ncbi:MAG TPA: leucine-rich repeat domain-containing protein [Verrucomicrobiae bacterium]|nr:leucine-rich repeat domain-containing protein [Verrucomicrobiae bacterium]